MEWSNEKPWNGLGADIDPILSPHEMLIKAKLDHEQPYKSPASHETFRFMKAFIEAGEAQMMAVGSMAEERVIWVLARLNENFVLKGTDSVEGCLLFSSRDLAREKIQMQVMTVREVSSSTLQIPCKATSIFRNIFRRQFKPTLPFLTPGATQLDDKMIQKAQKNIGVARKAIAGFASEAQRLAEKSVDEATAHPYFSEVFQAEAEKETQLALDALGHAPGHDLESADQTAWGLLNAVTYVVDHHLGNNPDSRLRLAWFGSKAEIKKRALELALKLL